MSVSKDMIKINPSYVGPRNDLLSLVPENSQRVLDIGCSVGSLGAKLKSSRERYVLGVELDPIAAEQASKYLDKVISGNVEGDSVKTALVQENFDVVICGDILEHLIDPWEMLSFLVNEATAEKAVFIISLPNVGHWSTFYNLLIKKQWPLNQRGIHDRTHLRWFTVKDAVTIVESCGLTIEKTHMKTRMIEKIHPWNGGRVERILYKLFGSLLVHQVLIVCHKGH